MEVDAEQVNRRTVVTQTGRLRGNGSNGFVGEGLGMRETVVVNMREI